MVCNVKQAWLCIATTVLYTMVSSLPFPEVLPTHSRCSREHFQCLGLQLYIVFTVEVTVV